MKNSKVMLACISITVATWLTLSLFVWLFSSMSFKVAALQPALIFIMMLFGWVPAVVVGTDLAEQQ